MGGLPENNELEQPAQKVAIPLLGAELSVPGEVADGRFISMALAEMLGGPETQFPTKTLPIKGKPTTINGDQFEQLAWITDITARFFPKADAVMSTLAQPNPQEFQNKIAEAISTFPPKTIVLDFEDIELIHWQDYSDKNSLSLNTLITLRNILEFLKPLQELAAADPASIKIKAKLHVNTHAGIALASKDQLENVTQRLFLAEEQFKKLLILLQQKLGINLPIEIVSEQNEPQISVEAKEKIAQFWEITTKIHSPHVGQNLEGNEPIKAWYRYHDSARASYAPQGGNIHGYDLALLELFNDKQYRDQFEATPGTDFFGHLTPQFKFDLLTRIALTEGLTGQTYSDLINNADLKEKAINWLTQTSLLKKSRHKSKMVSNREVHLSYSVSRLIEDEATNLLHKNKNGKLTYPEGSIHLKPLAGISELTMMTVPEFVRYHEPFITEEEIIRVIRASLNKKTQAMLIGGDKALAELFLKFANAKLTVRNTTGSDYAERPGKTHTAQINFPEIPDLSIPVKIRVAQKRETETT